MVTDDSVPGVDCYYFGCIGDPGENARYRDETCELAVKYKVEPLAIEAALRTCLRARRSRP